MGVSCITISIEEFEELNTCKRKLEKMKKLKEKNIEQLKETNRLVAEKASIGDKKACEELLRAQTAENIIYMAKISMIL